MAENKTKLTNERAEKFLKQMDDEQKQKDCFKILDMMKKITKEEPKMWGPSIIGFGSYHYKYESGREGDSLKIGFSPRKQNITLYIMSGFKRYEELMEKLGKYKTGKSCLYIKNLEDINLNILNELMVRSVKYISEKRWN